MLQNGSRGCRRRASDADDKLKQDDGAACNSRDCFCCGTVTGSVVGYPGCVAYYIESKGGNKDGYEWVACDSPCMSTVGCDENGGFSITDLAGNAEGCDDNEGSNSKDLHKNIEGCDKEGCDDNEGLNNEVLDTSTDICDDEMGLSKKSLGTQRAASVAILAQDPQRSPLACPPLPARAAPIGAEAAAAWRNAEAYSCSGTCLAAM